MAEYKKRMQSSGSGKLRLSDIGGISSPDSFSKDSSGAYQKTLGKSPAIGQSYDKVIGAGQTSLSGNRFSGGIPDLASLEAASMRLADAASRRSIAEKEAESGMLARMKGYSSLDEMMRDMQMKRMKEESELERMKEEEEKKKSGYTKIGGRWYR